MSRVCRAVLIAVLAASGAAPLAAGEGAAERLVVFAPWCMEKRLRRIVELFQEKCPTVPVRFTTGTPGQLISRVRKGARPDVYIAMGPAEVEVLGSLKLVRAGTPREILRQRLVLALGEKARGRVKSLRDLASPDLPSVGLGRPLLTSGRLGRVALKKVGVLEAVAPKARTSPLRSLVLGDVQAAIVYEECVYQEDLFVGATVLRAGIAFAEPFPKSACESFPSIALAVAGEGRHPEAATFVQTLTTKRAQDILHRRGEWACPICEME